MEGNVIRVVYDGENVCLLSEKTADHLCKAIDGKIRMLEQDGKKVIDFKIINLSNCDTNQIVAASKGEETDDYNRRVFKCIIWFKSK